MYCGVRSASSSLRFFIGDDYGSCAFKLWSLLWSSAAQSSSKYVTHTIARSGEHRELHRGKLQNSHLHIIIHSIGAKPEAA